MNLAVDAPQGRSKIWIGRGGAHHVEHGRTEYLGPVEQPLRNCHDAFCVVGSKALELPGNLSHRSGAAKSLSKGLDCFLGCALGRLVLQPATQHLTH
ncbi:MAG TPA: hypothetical protein VIT45_07590 [Allosphingosinicella sp.]